MPRWISDNGKWVPEQEKIGLINRSDKTKVLDGKKIAPGEPYIYDGPDRAALFELFEQKVEHLGQDFRRDPEFLQMIRSRNFKDVAEYLEFIGYDENKVKEEVDKRKATITQHELPKRVEALKVLGGGKNTAGAGDIYGDFGDPKDL